MCSNLGEITARSSLNLIGCLTPTTDEKTDCKPLTGETTMCTLPMLNHSVVTQIHCLIITYQQLSSWYWHPPGQFLCQLMVFQVPLKPLDNNCLPGWIQTGENGKKIWLKQYKMIIIACCRRKFRNQNWRYGHWNSHFGLNANFCGPFSHFLGTIPIFRVFQGPFQGYQPFHGFSGFSGVSGVAGHPGTGHQPVFKCLGEEWSEMGYYKLAA